MYGIYMTTTTIRIRRLARRAAPYIAAVAAWAYTFAANPAFCIQYAMGYFGALAVLGIAYRLHNRRVERQMDSYYAAQHERVMAFAEQYLGRKD